MYEEYIKKYIPLTKKDWTYQGGGQFLVRGIRVRRLPKILYQKIYDWCMKTPIKKTNIILETFWDLFWNPAIKV